MRKGWIASGLLVFLSATVHAAPTASDETFTSFIAVPCGKYAQEPNGPQKVYYDALVVGFITGIDYARARISPEEVSGYQTWMQEYCRNNPFSNLQTGVLELDKVLGEGRQPINAGKRQRK